MGLSPRPPHRPRVSLLETLSVVTYSGTPPHPGGPMRALLAVAVLMLVTACQAPPAEMTEAEHEAIVTAIMDQTDRMMPVWNAMDWEGAMAFYHPEKTAFAWNGTVYEYGNLLERWESVGSNFTAQESSWTDRKIEVLSEEAAILQGHFDLTLTRQNGSKINYPGNCVWTAIYEPYNGEWLMSYVSYNWGGYNVVEEG